MTNKSHDKIVYVVHAIDTEGPLYESFTSHFDRVNETFGLNIKPTFENLRLLQEKKLDVGGHEDEISEMLSDARISTNSTWKDIDQMLDKITSDEFRSMIPDSFGNGWVYNWFCMDHVGITGINPRRRDMGYHNIFDHYNEYFNMRQDTRDLIQWHYHPLSITNNAHRAGTTYLNSAHLHNIISRRIIDRSWFPVAFRAGHHAERPDSHFFLEQWVPFDYSNDSGSIKRANKSEARYGDWRRASASWIPYHPSYQDYQKIGDCQRYIAKCLPINERGYSITPEDIEQAFLEADQNGASILAVTNHDFRDMEPDVIKVMKLLEQSAKKHQKIKFRYGNAINAMRGVFNLPANQGAGLKASIKNYKTHDRLIVESENNIFGVQPYLAIKTSDNNYYWQNFDFEDANIWSYSFDIDNVMLDCVSEIGIAANSPFGTTEVVNVNPRNKKVKSTIYDHQE